MASKRSEATGWLVSLAFWVSLVTAAGLYGTVALAPKLRELVLLREKYADQQTELLALEQQVEQLRSTAEALRTDPRLGRELARVTFGQRDPEEQQIPVDDKLAWDHSRPMAPVKSTTPANPWSVPVLDAIVDRPAVANSLLAAAAVLVIYAFTCLQVRDDPLPAEDESLRQAA